MFRMLMNRDSFQTVNYDKVAFKLELICYIPQPLPYKKVTKSFCNFNPNTIIQLTKALKQCDNTLSLPQNLLSKINIILLH